MALLGHECRDDPMHKTSPATECEKDFADWSTAAKSQGLNTIQIVEHYDCACGTQGPSSWTHNRICQTEIIDFYGRIDSGGCSSANFKAGWAASRECACNPGLSYANCDGFGLSSIDPAHL